MFVWKLILCLISLLLVVIDGTKRFTVDVEYSWKPPRCMHCQVFGHTLIGCAKLKMEKTASAAATVEKQKKHVKDVWVVKQSKASKRNREPTAEEVVILEDASDPTSIADMNDNENPNSEQNPIQMLLFLLIINLMF